MSNKITFKELQQILNTEIPFDELKKNEGIYEVYEINDISIGVSYEDDEDGNECYIYNLFCGKDEYINVGEVGNKEEPINDWIVKELLENILKLIA